MKQIIAIIAIGFLASCSEDVSKRKDMRKRLLKEVDGHTGYVRYVDTTYKVGDTLSMAQGKTGLKQFVVVR
jgi:hypothetical protein